MHFLAFNAKAGGRCKCFYHKDVYNPQMIDSLLSTLVLIISTANETLKKLSQIGRQLSGVCFERCNMALGDLPKNNNLYCV